MNCRRVKAYLLILGLLTAIPLLSLLYACDANEARDTAGAEATSAQAEPAPEEEAEIPVSLRILCAGDIMVHEPQLAAQWSAATKTYDFSNNFAYVKEYIAGADLALCNLETTFGGEPYTGYPMFSSPDSLAPALAGAGFDVIFTSNNHMMDRGGAGLRRTLEIGRRAGLKTVGSRLEGETPSPVIHSAGLRIGLVSFTYETPQYGKNRTLNGIRVSDELEPLINSFGFEDLDGDLDRVAGEIKRTRDAGAEIVICYFHWGDEYKRAPNSYQQYIASRAAISGADIIFASHPHVPQGVEYLYPSPKRAVPVFYSLGNFISNQRLETRDNRYTEQGLMAIVDLQFMRSAGSIERIEARALPTWVDKYRSGGKDIYTIVPLAGDFENNPVLRASGHAERARQALADCEALLGEEYVYREE